MDTQKHIDALFSDYQETDALKDFKEELKTNLDDRIQNMVKKGMDEKAAFQKAIAELGDISALADEISLKKKQEVFGEMYMQTRNYMTTKRVALYVLCGVVLGFGLITALAAWFGSMHAAAPLGVLFPFGILPIAGFTFLGLTQETASHEPMTWKRALMYALTVMVFLFGILIFLIAILHREAGLMGAIGSLIPFVLPSLAFGAFLLLTEKDRRKAWLISYSKKMEQEHEYFSNPTQAARFGMICGAIWIAAIAGFILLTITVGFLFSWLALVGALVVQLIVMAVMMKGKK